MTDKTCVGAIAGAFGVRGEVRLKSFCTTAEDIATYGTLTTEDGTRRFAVTLTRPVNGGLGARLDELGEGLDLGGREDLVSTLSVLAMDEYSPATVLVSHHVEEIPPGFTHALLLRDGKAVAAGPLPHVLTEELLSRTFGLPLSVQEEDGRWAARRKAGRRA